MITAINGQHYQNLIDYGIRNLVLYCDKVNDLNVFPVPDGDTGTNMVKTLQNGFGAIAGRPGNLGDLSKKFAKAVVFGARGNSGVIISQFFKGFSECFYETEHADSTTFILALENGVKHAYRAVSHPVEGTVLTVLREATEHVKTQVESCRTPKNINEVMALFLEKAKNSLENTPNLLPILKSAGVVDSGGAGIIYVFEGMVKYLNNEEIVPSQEQQNTEFVDYTRFHRGSTFEYGYCTEFLLQLTDGAEPLKESTFKSALEEMGDSVVTVFEGDKIKTHIHTKTPEHVLTFAHRYGEFLSLKIENMSVQHSDTTPAVEIFHSGQSNGFAVVAVAQDETIKNLFLEMGADVVIAADNGIQPTTKDFVRAFEKTGAKQILVFPNSKNSNLAAMQASGFYADGEAIVFDTKSVAECYAALSMMDFEATDLAALEAKTRAIIDNVCTVGIFRAARDSIFNGSHICKNDFVAYTGSNVLGTGKERLAVTARAVEAILSEGERDTLTLFAGKDVPKEELDAISAYLEKRCPYTDLDRICTGYEGFELLLSFE